MNIHKKFILSLTIAMLAACGGSGESSTSAAPVIPPIASAQWNSQAVEIFDDDVVLLDGADSHSPEDRPLTYLWSLKEQPEQNTATIVDPESVKPSFTPSAPGNYVIALVVHDGRVSSSVASEIAFQVLDKDSKLVCDIYAPGTISIQTAQGEPIDRHIYSDASLRIAAAGQDSLTLKTEVRGRGNSTWGHDKKPLRLKLKKKDASPLLDMPQARNWALLANAFDGSMLRNAAALCLGQNFVRSSWTPHYRFAELELDGAYNGLYQLTEHVEIAEHKVDLVDNDTENNIDADAFFIEMTPAGRVNTKDIFIQSSQGIYFEVKSDVSDDPFTRDQQLKSIKSYVDGFEAAMSSGNFDPVNGYAKYIDTDSAIDYILLNELFKDNDRFWASTHFHKPKNGKMVFGPIWDYDLSAGNYICDPDETPQHWWVGTRNYPGQLFKDPVFREKTQIRWKALNAKIPNLVKYIEAEGKNIDAARAKNFDTWPFSTQINVCDSRPTTFLANTPGEQAVLLQNWLTERAQWMNAQFTGPLGGP